VRVSARADYALRAVAELAAGDGSPVKREQLAERQGIPLDFLEHVLLELKHAGIVMTNVRGRRPEEVDYPGPAEHLQDVWIAVRASLRDLLESVSVEDLVSGELSEQIKALTLRPDAYRSLGRVRGPSRAEVP
jgi:DNA-binding IscR family transcriptional regulator